jgi:hypothetical protein
MLEMQYMTGTRVENDDWDVIVDGEWHEIIIDHGRCLNIKPLK